MIFFRLTSVGDSSRDPQSKRLLRTKQCLSLYSARHLNPTKSNSNGNLTDLVFRFFNGFPLISTYFHGFLRIFTIFHGFSTDFKQISAVFSSLQLNYIVQKMLGEKNNMPLYTKYIINRVTN